MRGRVILYQQLPLTFKELIFFFVIWKALKKNHGNFLRKYGNNLIFFKLSIIVLQV